MSSIFFFIHPLTFHHPPKKNDRNSRISQNVEVTSYTAGLFFTFMGLSFHTGIYFLQGLI